MKDERFDELVLLHFDGCLGEADERALAQWLARSVEARARFRLLSRIEGGTAHVARAGVLPSEGIAAAHGPPRARRRASAWLPRLAAAAIVAVAAVAGAWALASQRAPEPTVVVATLAGDGSVHRGRSTLPLTVGMALHAGDEIEAGASAASAVGLAWRDEPTSLSLGAGATLSLARLRAPERLELSSGTLEAQIASQPPSQPMVFACGDTEAEVIGTRLKLARVGATTRLEVIEGRVRLVDAAGAVEVPGGAVAEAVASAAPELVPVPGPDGVERVWTARMLARAVASADDGRVIEIASGVYRLDAPLVLPRGVKGVALRGEGSDPHAVRISGGGAARFLVELSGVSAITIADLTLEDAGEHLVFIHGDLGCDGLIISHVRFGDSPGNSLRMIGAGGVGAARGSVLDCDFDNAGTVANPLFLAYIDLVGASGWRIAHCRFHPMRLSDPAAFPTASAILLSGKGSGNVVDGNVIAGCRRGITLGVGDAADGNEQQGGRIVDNMISRRAGERGDAGISINAAPDVLVAHNTVLLRGTYADAIEYRWGAAVREAIADNCTDAGIAARDGATATLEANQTQADASWFVDADAGDLHLKAPPPQALLAGVPVPGVAADIDGDAFGARAIIGADQPR